MNVELSEEAEAHVLEIDAWWRDNRQAEDLFIDELEETLAALGETPGLGTKYDVLVDDTADRYGMTTGDAKYLVTAFLNWPLSVVMYV